VSAETFVGQPAGIALVGFMGAGKTSTGEVLSRRLGWPFEDLDDWIELRQGSSVEQIFQEHGEAGFRRAEHAALKELLEKLASAPKVLALGGGAFAQPENRDLLAKAPIASVFLDAPVEELFNRCRLQGKQRPLFGSLEQFRRLHDKRQEHYCKARYRVDTSGKEVEAVASEVAWVLGMSSTK
jgi:shikimate kinase